MSGIVAVLHLDGAPVDESLLRRMTAFMTFRGPDAQRTWLERQGSVGFGHTWLDATNAASTEAEQPFALDDRTWIVADARIDARQALVDRLDEAEGACIGSDVADVELIARAYRAWGERCVEHLLGDFAFVVWDARARRLFVARDHLGVKPLYYAHLGATVVVSNTLDCVRQHPRVSARLDDLAIADFLLFDLNQDPSTTSFADVRRLPPAHRATFSADAARVDRYWRLPVDEPIRYRRAADYEEHLRELLDTSVRDRARAGRVGVFMSGGLDSGTLAASAREVLGDGAGADAVRAFVYVWDGFDEDERRYAGLTASFLRIPIEYRDVGKEPADEARRWQNGTPEPVRDPLSNDGRYFRALSERARVFFYGEGPDNALGFEWPAYLRYMLRRRQPARLLLEMAAHALRHRRIPLLPTIPRMIRERVFGTDWTVRFPLWLNKSFEQRLKLRDRWAELQVSPVRPEAMRPASHAGFESPLWESLFRGWDPEATGAPFEVRHPFVDLRVLRYLLSVPTLPWCRSKYLLRRAMRGRLPDPVLRRRKALLASDPLWEATRRTSIGPLDPAAGLDQYVDARSVPDSGKDRVQFRTDARPYKLNYWLRHTQGITRPRETP